MASIKNKNKDVEKDSKKVELDDILNSKKLDGKFSSHYIHSTSSLQPIGIALDRISKNEEESEERISFLDFEVFKAPRLKSDYSYPILHDFLPFQTLYLSIWPKFEHKPVMMQGESWHCVIDGREKMRLMSPVFNQNLYQNVYEDVEPHTLPEALDLFKIDAEKFPLLDEVREYILEAELSKGDCIFVPSLYWYQFET